MTSSHSTLSVSPLTSAAEATRQSRDWRESAVVAAGGPGEVLLCKDWPGRRLDQVAVKDN